MMDRRRFLLTSLAGALAVPLAAEAQRAGKVYRLGILSPAGLPPRRASSHLHIIDVLREVGHVGQEMHPVPGGMASARDPAHPVQRGDAPEDRIDVPGK